MKTIKTITLGALCALSQLSFADWPDYLTKEEKASLDAVIKSFPRSPTWQNITYELHSKAKWGGLNPQQMRLFLTKFPCERLTSNIIRLLRLDSNTALRDQVMQCGLPRSVDEKLCSLLDYPPISEEQIRKFAEENGREAFFNSSEVFRMAHHNPDVLGEMASSLFGDWIWREIPGAWQGIREIYLSQHPDEIR